MVCRRETIAEALRKWRVAERELGQATNGRRAAMEADVARYRATYQQIYTEAMEDNLARLHDADDRRARATPSTRDFPAATQDTQDIAADIWEQAPSDRDTPPTRLDPIGTDSRR